MAASLLAAAGLGSTTSTPPTLYVGQYPEVAPDAMMALRELGGAEPELYLGARAMLLEVELQVLVRGSRNTAGATLERARQAWAALVAAKVPDGYASMRPGSLPEWAGEDENGRPRYSFRFTYLYRAAWPSAAP
jgi:hypothetical protein